MSETQLQSATPELDFDATEPKPHIRFPKWALLVSFVFAIAIAVVQYSAESWDRAWANVISWILLGVVIGSPIFWFTFVTPFRWRVRLIPVCSVAFGTVMFFQIFEIQGCTGSLTPTSIKIRGSKDRDEELLEHLPASNAKIDLKTETPDDYPQFLGPDRNQTIRDLHLARDWQASPPRLRWKVECGLGWASFATRNGYAWTMEQRGPQEIVTYYDVQEGKVLGWHGIQAKHATLLGGAGPRSTPTIDDGRVYALGATGVLRCLDGADGKLLWQHDLLHDFNIPADKDIEQIAWGRAASPLVVDNLVIVPAGGPAEGPFVSLVAYDKITGDEKWRSGEQQVSYSSPVLTTLAGVRQVVIVNESTVSGHRLDGSDRDGEVLWVHSWPGSSSTDANVAQPVPLDKDRILLTKAYGQGAQVFEVTKSRDGKFATKIQWANESLLKTKHTNVVVYDGHAFGLSDGILECVDLESGRRRWKRGRYNHGQILLVGDVILVQTESSGELVMVEANPRRHVELGRIESIPGQTWNNLCLHGNLLLLRNAAWAACFELPLR